MITAAGDHCHIIDIDPANHPHLTAPRSRLIYFDHTKRSPTIALLEDG